MADGQLPLTVPQLRHIAARAARLPDGPWRAVELTALEVGGPRRWDPDIDPDRARFDQQEQVRGREACWRGLLAEDGRRLVGQPLKGGRPEEVVDPVWLFAAEARTAVPALLDTVRALWPRPAGGVAPVPVVDEPAPPPPVDVEMVARATYGAVPCPTSWDELPEVVRDEWRVRAAAATNACMDIVSQ